MVKFTLSANYPTVFFLPLQPHISPHELALICLVIFSEDSRSHPRHPTYADAETSAIAAAMICQSNISLTEAEQTAALKSHKRRDISKHEHVTNHKDRPAP